MNSHFDAIVYTASSVIQSKSDLDVVIEGLGRYSDTGSS
jgi:hypothetical protein